MSSSLTDQVMRAVEESYRDAGTGDSVLELARRRVAAIVRSHGLRGDELRELKRSARAAMRSAMTQQDATLSAAFHARFGTNEAEQREITQWLTPAMSLGAAGVQRAQDKVVPIVMQELERSKRTGRDFRQTAAVLVRKLDAAEQHVRTEVSTAKAAMDRASRVTRALASGVEFFRYSGGSGRSRVFCLEHVGNTYHVDDIRRMDNGQGLPVLYYCGGYNCIHRLEAVFADELGINEHGMNVLRQFRQFSNMPVPANLAALVRRPVTVQPGKASFYREDGISIDEDWAETPRMANRSAIHELTHAITEQTEDIVIRPGDRRLSERTRAMLASVTDKLFGAADNERPWATQPFPEQRALAERINPIIARDGDVVREYATRRKIPLRDVQDMATAAADCIAAASRGKIGYGHHWSYWDDEMFPAAELTAHAMELKLQGNRFFAEMFPDMHDALIEWADTILETK